MSEELTDVTVYRTQRGIVITGYVAAEDETHNCDAMGCGQEHVLYRFPLSETPPVEQQEQP